MRPRTASRSPRRIQASSAFLVALAVLTSIGACPGFAAQKLSGPPETKDQPAPRPTKGKVTISQLTAAECTTLGGSVKDLDTCNSGKVCLTKDQNSKSHMVCLEAAK
ncbi:MAG TPA: hypothetical protein VGN97_09745 [Mesorhizobium sp.]|jgi:hypothetical protein|nr:hypothetical protein [Mesorhizobium sp.]